MINTDFNPFPTLTTERLVLRTPEAADARDIFIHRCDDRVNTYLEDFRHATVEQSQAYITRVLGEIAAGKTIMWVITEKGRHRFLGTICLWNISKEERKAETGYTLVTECQGKGYMQEALAKIIKFGFNTMNLEVIEAYTHEHNNNSIRLLLRNKFRLQPLPGKPVGSDRIFFTLSRDQQGWPASYQT